MFNTPAPSHCANIDGCEPGMRLQELMIHVVAFSKSQVHTHQSPNSKIKKSKPVLVLEKSWPIFAPRLNTRELVQWSCNVPISNPEFATNRVGKNCSQPTSITQKNRGQLPEARNNSIHVILLTSRARA